MSGKRKHIKIFGVDTNIFIYHYQNNPKFVSKTDIFFNALVEEKIRSITSIITLIELLSFKASEKEISSIQDAFLTTPNLTVMSIELEIASKAAAIRRSYGFRLPDAIQLASALHAKADEFLTNDQRLKSFKEIKIKLISELDELVT